ncbi:HpcH/HpaI aldolase family protein [Inquilinus limosus]|uniref:HpcH/HpaI aldolase family protein n=1 Tax=Inquilinus limosus TaxID=171674 RepID=UPI00040DA0DC|nr:aldolase/citrate lyase family protein [Inquilinus limosus]
MYRPNAAKRKLRAGEPVYGCWQGLGNSLVSELLGLAGYDIVLLDHEHGPASVADAVPCLQALAGTPATGIVRMPWNDPVYAKRILDIGAEGVMVPQVGSKAEAEAAVAACRYPPAGTRGVAYGIARGADFGLAPDYRETVDDNLLILCQIETRQGVEAIPDIAAVDGVDALFIGPWDLSGSLGKLGRFDDPEVRDTIRRAERAVLDSGKWLGALPSLGRSPAEMVRDGCRIVIAPADITLLRDAARADIAAFREATGKAGR